MTLETANKQINNTISKLEKSLENDSSKEIARYFDEHGRG